MTDENREQVDKEKKAETERILREDIEKKHLGAIREKEFLKAHAMYEQKRDAEQQLEASMAEAEDSCGSAHSVSKIAEGNGCFETAESDTKKNVKVVPRDEIPEVNYKLPKFLNK